MIRSFADKATERLWPCEKVPSIDPRVQQATIRKLAQINEIVHGQRRITADTALRLGRYFAIDPQFWINLQSHYDLEVERDALGDSLDSIQPLRTA